MTARIIDGKVVAARMTAEVADDATAFRNATGIVPHLVAVLVGDDPASAVYVRKNNAPAKKPA